MATVSEGGAWGATWAGAKATHARALEYCMAMVPLRACVSLTATRAEPSWLVRGQGVCLAKVLRVLACCVLTREHGSARERWLPPTPSYAAFLRVRADMLRTYA